MPTFPSFDLTNVQLPNVQLPVQLPDVKLPDVTFPDVTLPEIDTDRLVGIARDAAYVGIGLGVLAVQQTQVRRREVQSELERRVRQLSDRLATVR